MIKPKGVLKVLLLWLIIILFFITSLQGRRIAQLEQELEIAQDHIWTLYYEQEGIREQLEAIKEQRQNEAQERVGRLLEYIRAGIFEEFTLTAYTVDCGNGDGVTSIGVVPQVGRTIAVDPRVIPYGSLVYVEGFGWRVAEDTGGAIKGNKIDLFVDSKSEAFQIGRRNVMVVVF